ncbi:hypothetical protein [Leptospira noguchii]|uniref:hypothetical protein n=1 Tax=Leptospira noguchii TaxID=28182 RepID=UPI001FB7B459|nr:hypothetical protein [Leptospira noguchii]UOG30013.1 hypothetical protein MAL06_15560 [Leptospira noguchii]
MIFLNRRSQEGRWQIDRSLNSAQSFPMGRLGNSMHRFLWVALGNSMHRFLWVALQGLDPDP